MPDSSESRRQTYSSLTLSRSLVLKLPFPFSLTEVQLLDNGFHIAAWTGFRLATIDFSLPQTFRFRIPDFGAGWDQRLNLDVQMLKVVPKFLLSI
mgnify:CR=1 FL=1